MSELSIEDFYKNLEVALEAQLKNNYTAKSNQYMKIYDDMSKFTQKKYIDTDNYVDTDYEIIERINLDLINKKNKKNKTYILDEVSDIEKSINDIYENIEDEVLKDKMFDEEDTPYNESFCFEEYKFKDYDRTLYSEEYEVDIFHVTDDVHYNVDYGFYENLANVYKFYDFELDEINLMPFDDDIMVDDFEILSEKHDSEDKTVPLNDSFDPSTIVRKFHFDLDNLLEDKEVIYYTEERFALSNMRLFYIHEESLYIKNLEDIIISNLTSFGAPFSFYIVDINNFSTKQNVYERYIEHNHVHCSPYTKELFISLSKISKIQEKNQLAIKRSNNLMAMLVDKCSITNANDLKEINEYVSSEQSKNLTKYSKKNYSSLLNKVFNN
ncbi:MAG: hypothetical protein R3Y64_09000 [Peptostreptococcaceae bacterium]